MTWTWRKHDVRHWTEVYASSIIPSRLYTYDVRRNSLTEKFREQVFTQENHDNSQFLYWLLSQGVWILSSGTIYIGGAYFDKHCVSNPAIYDWIWHDSSYITYRYLTMYVWGMANWLLALFLFPDVLSFCYFLLLNRKTWINEHIISWLCVKWNLLQSKPLFIGTWTFVWGRFHQAIEQKFTKTTFWPCTLQIAVCIVLKLIYCNVIVFSVACKIMLANSLLHHRSTSPSVRLYLYQSFRHTLICWPA